MSKGNIIKISNGHMNEIAKLEHTSSAKTINSNAAGTINEKGTEGVKFGEPKEMKFTTVDGVDILAGMFFDGTLNNKFNTASEKGKGSYQNDYSNVARLFKHYEEIENTVVVYTEGMGTTTGGEDDSAGSGFGDGKTGIPARVAIGCGRLVDGIMKIVGKKTVNTLTIDVFGFSRGAAAARHFIYEITKPGYAPSKNTFSADKYDAHDKITTLDKMPDRGELGRLLLENNIKIKDLVIRFVGLFDTVSSFNKGGFSASPNFDNDVAELHLNQLFRAQKVIHFTAENEHRTYFALTHIQSAGDKGIELPFPGVHSDVGGSYKDGMEHVDEIIKGFKPRLTAEKERLITEGWYKDGELTVNSWSGTLSGDRDLKKDYSYIPLHFMCKFGTDYKAPLPLDQSAVEEEFIVTTDTKDTLGFIKKRLHSYVFDKGEPLKFKYYSQLQADLKAKKISPSEYNRQLEEQKHLRVLRNKYLHWSADYDGTFELMAPNFENNQRKRIPHDG
jgi:hypothetical protein